MSELYRPRGALQPFARMRGKSFFRSYCNKMRGTATNGYAENNTLYTTIWGGQFLCHPGAYIIVSVRHA